LRQVAPMDESVKPLPAAEAEPPRRGRHRCCNNSAEKFAVNLRDRTTRTSGERIVTRV
jgi:hypothetical protein